MERRYSSFLQKLYSFFSSDLKGSTSATVGRKQVNMLRTGTA